MPPQPDRSPPEGRALADRDIEIAHRLAVDPGLGRPGLAGRIETLLGHHQERPPLPFNAEPPLFRLIVRSRCRAEGIEGDAASGELYGLARNHGHDLAGRPGGDGRNPDGADAEARVRDRDAPDRQGRGPDQSGGFGPLAADAPAPDQQHEGCRDQPDPQRYAEGRSELGKAEDDRAEARDHDRDEDRPAKPHQRGPRRVTLPVQHRPEGNQHQQRDEQRYEGHVVIRGADRNLVPVQHIDEHRIEGAEEDRGRCGQQEQVVQGDTGFTR